MKNNDPAKPNRKPEPGWVEKELYRYYADAQSYAEASRVPMVVLHGKVPQNIENFYNEGVLTDKGAQVVADLLMPEVEKQLK